MSALGDQPNGPALAVRQDAEAIVLDFMNLAGTARSSSGTVALLKPTPVNT
jgi:hypothetical protein